MRGSFNIGRRIEQSFGGWMAHYTRFKAKDPSTVDVYDYMPHEREPEISFEEERIRAIKEKSA